MDIPDASAAELFEFHQDPGQMNHILPRGQKLLRYEGEATATQGAHLVLHLRLFFVLPLRWKVRWETVDYPIRLVDESVEGPFAMFLHEHRFRDLPEGGARMTDHIIYALPLPWLTWPLALTVVYLQLAWMFRVRHRKTREHFANLLEKRQAN